MYQNPGHIQDVDGYEQKKSKTYSEKFTTQPLAVSEKPKTPTAVSNKDVLPSPVHAESVPGERHLFESYVPAALEPLDVEIPVQKPPTPAKVKTPTSSALPSVVRKAQSQAGSVEDSKPLHKRIDREEYIKDVQNFYGAHTQPEAPSKISRLIEELDNQKKVMDKLDRKQKDILVNSKLENRRTAAQMIDKFIQTT